MRAHKRTKCIYRAVLSISLAVLCPLLTHASAAASVIQRSGLVYVPSHSVFFADVDEHLSWVVQPVDYLANAGIVSGTDHCVYSPEDKLSRADFVTMLNRAYDMEEYVGGGSFSDVSENAYYSSAVSAAKNLGIVSGDAKGKFDPKGELTRQDAMVMLRRTLNKSGLLFEPGDLGVFSDAESISRYAQGDIAALAKAGVISGASGKLNPKQPVTRAEMAVMLYRAMMLEPDEDGNPAYMQRDNVVNLCVGNVFYANVIVENAAQGQKLSGLYACEEMQGEGEDFTVKLGESRTMDQKVDWKNGILTVNGQAVTVAEDCDAVSISPYGLISGGLVSTGEAYSTAAVSLVDGIVTAVYYQK